MNLERHYDDGKYLPEGDHRVEIIKFRRFTANSGTEGLEYIGRDEHGKDGKITFWLTEASEWRLGHFARDCGLPREAAAGFQDEMLIGLHVVFVVRKETSRTDPNNAYNVVTDWYSIEQLGQVPPTRPQEAPKTGQQTMAEIERRDLVASIPF